MDVGLSHGRRHRGPRPVSGSTAWEFHDHTSGPRSRGGHRAEIAAVVDPGGRAARRPSRRRLRRMGTPALSSAGCRPIARKARRPVHLDRDQRGDLSDPRRRWEPSARGASGRRLRTQCGAAPPIVSICPAAKRSDLSIGVCSPYGLVSGVDARAALMAEVSACASRPSVCFASPRFLWTPCWRWRPQRPRGTSMPRSPRWNMTRTSEPAPRGRPIRGPDVAPTARQGQRARS